MCYQIKLKGAAAESRNKPVTEQEKTDFFTVCCCQAPPPPPTLHIAHPARDLEHKDTVSA